MDGGNDGGRWRISLTVMSLAVGGDAWKDPDQGIKPAARRPETQNKTQQQEPSLFQRDLWKGHPFLCFSGRLKVSAHTELKGLDEMEEPGTGGWG